MAQTAPISTYAPDDAWFDSLGPLEQIGLSPAIPPAQMAHETPPGLARSTGPGGYMASVPPWNPHNALFPFAVLLAAAVGLAAASTSFKVRVGKADAGVNANLGKV